MFTDTQPLAGWWLRCFFDCFCLCPVVYAAVQERPSRHSAVHAATLVRTVFPSGAAIENVYENGQLRRVKTPEGDVVMDYLCSAKIGTVTMGTEFLNFEYDGPLVTSLEQAGELNALLTFGYDDTMRLESFGYAGGTTTFGYDLDGLLTTIGDFTIERDAANGLPLAVDDETARLEREFNGYGEVERQTLSVAGNAVGEVALARDVTGRIIAKTETIGGVAYEYEYEYDDFGRLTVVRDGAGSELERYSYGPQGERLTETNVLRGIVSRRFTYDDEDRLLTAGDEDYTFDDDGFLTSKTDGSETTTYGYSSRGELKKVELPDGKVVEYRHDPWGRRVAKIVDGVVTEKYLWLDRATLLAVYDGDNTPKSRFLYADARMPMGMVQDDETYYFIYDQVGSLRAVTDAIGTVVKFVRYDSFGNVIEDSNPALKVPFGFAGGVHDRDTGLVRFGYRDYDPDTGRWTAKDPIGFISGSNDVFLYCEGNPIGYVDIDGLQLVLPDNPYGLPWCWMPDFGYLYPLGVQYRHPSGEILQFHFGHVLGKGNQKYDHWHYYPSGRAKKEERWGFPNHDHLSPGTVIPAPPCPSFSEACKNAQYNLKEFFEKAKRSIENSGNKSSNGGPVPVPTYALP